MLPVPGWRGFELYPRASSVRGLDESTKLSAPPRDRGASRSLHTGCLRMEGSYLIREAVNVVGATTGTRCSQRRKREVGLNLSGGTSSVRGSSRLRLWRQGRRADGQRRGDALRKRLCSPLLRGNSGVGRHQHIMVNGCGPGGGSNRAGALLTTVSGFTTPST